MKLQERLCGEKNLRTQWELDKTLSLQGCTKPCVDMALQ